MAEQGRKKNAVVRKLDFGDKEKDADLENNEEVDDKEKEEMQALQGESSITERYQILAVIHSSKPDQVKTKGYPKRVPPETPEVDPKTESHKRDPDTSV